MATIRDVARVSGVSIATVSRVLNGSERVSDDARRRVRAAARKLDYSPNVAARSLTTSRTHAIGVLLPDLFGEFFSEVIRGIDHAARDERFQVLVSSSHADTEALVTAARALHGRIDGLVVMVPEVGSASAARRLSRQFTTVVLNAPGTVNGCESVSIANFDGARAVVRHLVGLGHRRIAIVCGPRGNVDADERRRGYRAALAEAGVARDPRLEHDGDFTESSGYRLAAALLEAGRRPTAVFAANDYMAIGLLGALRDAGVAVPRDIAVAGFDDIAIAQYLSPALTTVRVDAYGLGERAARALIAQLETPGRRTRSHDVLPATLVVRGSCGATGPRVPEPRLARRGKPSLQPASWRHHP